MQPARPLVAAMQRSTMFDTLPPAPPDSIPGLTDACQKDPNSRKMNLGVGVYKDEHGQAAILAGVEEAVRRLLASEQSKGYVPMEGHGDYDARAAELQFGSGHEITASGRAITAQTPGGTGSLR